MNNQSNDEFCKSIKVETLLNRENNQLPFGLFNPECDGKLTWICGHDQDEKITSVFCFDHGTHKEKTCIYLESHERAIYMRDELVNNGWKKLIPPKVTFSMPDGSNVPINRKTKRVLSKKLKNLMNNGTEN